MSISWSWDASNRAIRGLAAAAAVSCACLLTGAAAPPAGARAAPRAVQSHGAVLSHIVSSGGATVALHRVGTVILGALARADARRQARPAIPQAARHFHVTPLRLPPGAVGVKGAGVPGGTVTTKLAGNVRGAHGFDGLTSAVSGAVNSRLASGIGYVSPPDPTLAVGQSPKGTAVVEFAGDAFSIYAPNGKTLLRPVPGYQVFRLRPGVLLSDPRAFHESAGTGYWYLTASVAGDGVKSPRSTQYVAVSQTASPFGRYTIFSLNTSDAGDTAGGCPCFGVFDQLGFSDVGTYLSVSRFSVDHANFDGSVIYVLRGLTSAAERPGGPAPVAHVYVLPSSGDPFGAFDLSPSQYAPGVYPNDEEYFVESDSDAAGGSGLEVYALLYHGVLCCGKPPLLVEATVPTEAYSLPPGAVQRHGPTPYGCSVKSCATAMLNTDFDAVQEVTWTHGILYVELDTGVRIGSSQRSGVAWFALSVEPHSYSVSASLIRDGYLETSQNMLDPVIAVNGGTGMGYLAFAVSGPARYPSAAYVAFDATRGPVGPIRLAAKGTDPLDDFTCYPKFSSGLCRYGDYASAQYWRGRIYMAAEYVPDKPRDAFSNWGTRIWYAPLP